MACCRLLSAIQCSAGLRSRLRPSGRIEKSKEPTRIRAATIPASTMPMVMALPVSLFEGISGMAILHVPRRLPKKRPWRLPSSAQREGRRPKPTPRLIINALLLPIYRWRPFPRPSLVPPVEPEKSRAARAGLLHARNALGAHRSFKQS
jgi:hypothetical protein